mgnify:FL=1
MAVTAKLYGKMVLSAFGKGIDWVNDSIKVALCTASYTPDQDAHQYYSDLTNELPTGGGYTAGGIALTGRTATYDAATNKTKLDADDLSIATATFDCRYAAIFDDTPAADKPLLGYVDFGETISPRNGLFKIEWAADGAISFTVE